MIEKHKLAKKDHNHSMTTWLLFSSEVWLVVYQSLFKPLLFRADGTASPPSVHAPMPGKNRER